MNTAGDVEVESVSGRSVLVRYQGHRFQFHFPEGWAGGLPELVGEPIWKDGKKPDDPYVRASAATIAIDEAIRNKWRS